jgi:hypothetical protein
VSDKAKTPLEHWVSSYQKLRQTRVDLDRFMEERYERFVRVVAHEYWDIELESKAPNTPCEFCKVTVSSIIVASGWYCEWDCQGTWQLQGRCGLDGTGWYTPLQVVEAYLATHEIT